MHRKYIIPLLLGMLVSSQALAREVDGELQSSLL